jgi:hypothetical protein
MLGLVSALLKLGFRGPTVASELDCLLASGDRVLLSGSEVLAECGKLLVIGCACLRNRLGVPIMIESPSGKPS